MNKKKYPYKVKYPNSASAKDLKSLSWQSLVFYNQLYLTTKNRETNGLWINIPSKTLLKKFGKFYAKHIAELAKRDWIEINARYSNCPDGFTKSYRLSDSTFAHRHKNFITNLGKKSWEKLTQSSLTEDTSDLSSKYLELIKQRHDLLFIPNVPRSRDGKILKGKLEGKISKLSRGKNYRVYSTIISSPKKLREAVVFGTKGKMVNVDVTAMIQQILNIGINDPEWNRWIKNDFISCLSKSMYLVEPRQKIKTLFMKAISKKTRHPLAMQISKHLRKEFPQIMSKIDDLNYFSSVQLETQKREAILIENFIMSHQHLTMIPAHDGVFCGEFEALRVKDALESFLRGKGLVGATKISPDLPHLRQRTLLEILESIPEPPSLEHKAS